MSIDSIFGSVARAGRVAAAVIAAAIAAGTIEAVHAAEVATPSTAGLARITEFFDNEIATGKLPGCRRLDPAAWQAGLSEVLWRA